KTTDPGVARSKQAFKLDQQPACGEQQALGAAHLCRQLELRGEARRRREVLAYLGHSAESAIEIIEQRLPATPRQPIARQGNEPSNLGKPDAFKKFKNFGLEAEGC